MGMVDGFKTVVLDLCIVCVTCLVCPSFAADGKRCEYSTSQQYGHDRAEFSVANCKGFVILPDKEKRSNNMPWVWYAPTFIPGLPGEINGWICKRLLDQGIAVCGVDVGESYGSPKGRAAFTQFHRFVVSKFRLSTKACLWAQSRGGLMLFNWAVEHPSFVKCIGGTYPVCDLTSYPRRLEEAAPAYGMTADELRSQLAQNNPIDRLAPLAVHKVPVFLMHGDADGVVPIEQKFARRYTALGGQVQLSIIPGVGHAEVPEFFQSQDMVDFFVMRTKT